MEVISPFSDEEPEEEPTTSSKFKKGTAVTSDHILQYKAQVRRKVETLKYNPSEEVHGEKLEQYATIVVDVMRRAANDTFIADIDSEWLSKQLVEITDDQEQQEDLHFIRNYLLKLAQSAAIEVQMTVTSDRLLAKRLSRIRLRVDEFDERPAKTDQRSSSEHDNLGRHRSTSRKRSWRQRDDNIKLIKKEEIKNETFINIDIEPEQDRYQCKTETEDIDDIFAKSPSPPPARPSPKKEEEKPTNGRILFSPRDIERRPAKPKVDESPKLPTQRQLIIQRIAGHVEHVQKPDQSEWEPLPTNGEIQQRGKIKRKNKQQSQRKRQIKPKASEKTHSPTKPVHFDASTSSEEDEDEDDLSDESPTTIMVFQTVAGKKSNLKKRQSGGFRAKWNIEFRPEVQDNCGKSAKNPWFHKQFDVTKPGQQITRFTMRTKPLASIENNFDEETTILKMVPSSDHPIRIARRDNPMINRQNMNNMKSDMCKELAHQLRSWEGPSRLLIADSIMTQLDKTIFKNMHCFELNYPRMPEWFLEALGSWWMNNKEKQTEMFTYTKIFILIGMDLNVFYAHPKAKQEEDIFKFLTHLSEWFDARLKEVSASVKARGNVSPYYLKNAHKENVVDSPEVRCLHLNQKPEFVVVTVPETGDWRSFFVCLNQGLRDFVKKNPTNFTLLDWAEMLNKKSTELETVEQRTAILIKAMHTEHGVLYR